MTPASRIAAVSLLSSLALTGCTQASDAPEADWPSVDAAPVAASADKLPAELPRPCLLVTAEDAQAVIGAEVGQMADDQDVCMWAGGENPGAITMLMVQVFRTDTPEETASLFDNLSGLSGNLGMMVNEAIDKPTRKSGQDIEDLGDAAWCSASNADLIGTQQMIVRTGTVLLSLNVTGMTKGERAASLCPQLEVASRLAYQRLGGAR
ncbi:hypothetical protein [Arenimonas sp. MALMAid1274]|uniref:hypothetical protein n=1 Tax=Arenimonas sp. MALMAid1274 TaxID=3411630 RepID=UPI003B9EB4E8